MLTQQDENMGTGTSPSVEHQPVVSFTDSEHTYESMVVMLPGTNASSNHQSAIVVPIVNPRMCAVCGAGHADTFLDLPATTRERLLKLRRVAPCNAFQLATSLRLEISMRAVAGINNVV
jgi:hypothetical protein